MIKQLAKDDCGLTCIRYVLYSITKKRKYASYPLTRKCDSLLSMKQELESFGLKASAYAISKDDLSKIPKYSIVKVDYESTSHFMVLVSYSHNHIVFYDPVGKYLKFKSLEKIDLNMSACLTFDGEIKEIPNIYPLPISKHILLAVLSVLECSLICLFLATFQLCDFYFSIIYVLLFALTLSLHITYGLQINDYLDKKLVIPYLCKVTKVQDFETIIKLKTHILRPPLVIYSMISSFGLLIFLMLSIGLPYLISSLIYVIYFLLMSHLIDESVKNKSSEVEKSEDSIKTALKRHTFSHDDYKKCDKGSRKIATLMCFKWVILIIFSIVLALLQSYITNTFEVETIVRTLCMYLVISNLVNYLLKKIKEQDLILNELSILNPYAYKLLCRDEKLSDRRKI